MKEKCHAVSSFHSPHPNEKRKNAKICGTVSGESAIFIRKIESIQKTCYL